MFAEPLNIINGNIITLGNTYSKANSVTMKNGRILSVNMPNNSFRTIDARGYTIIPGFTDAHFHITNLGKRMEMINLKKINSIQEIVDKVIHKKEKLNKGEWIQGFGWDHNNWENKKFPENNILNSVAPENPVILTRIDGHAIWVNNKASQIITENIENIQGGKIINECIYVDNAMNLIKSNMPKDTKVDIKKWIINACNRIVRYGITNVHDAWQSPLMIESIFELIDENKFPIKCYGMIGGSFQDYLDNFFKKGTYLGKKYKIRAVKAFIDGALGSRGAALLEPYNDEPNNCGLTLISKGEFKTLAQKCYDYNFQLCTHAIGDRGNRLVLDTYSKILKEKNNKRWRIEHAQMLTSNDIDRLNEYSIIASMQPTHCTSDMKWLKDRLGTSRLHRISRWSTLIKKGITIAGGSDCPIEDGNPLFEFYAAITRQDHSGLPKHGWQKQEILTRYQALEILTKGGAFAEFSDNCRGKIELGFDADLTILSKDITKIPVKEILETEIMATIIDGHIAYKHKNF